MAEADYPGSPYCAVNFYPSEVDQHGYGMHGRCEAVKKPCGAVDRGPDAEGAMTASLPIDRGGTQDPHRPIQHRTPPPPPQPSGHCVWGEGHADCSMPKTENENAAHCHESRAECEGPCAEDYASAWCPPGDTGMRRTIRYMPTAPQTPVDLSAGCPPSAPDCAWERVNGGTGTHCPGPCITVGETQSRLECQIAAVSKDRTIGTDAARRRPNAPCAIVWFERSHDCHLATRCTGDGLTNLRQGWVLDLAGVRNEQPAPQPPPPPTGFGCDANEPDCAWVHQSAGHSSEGCPGPCVRLGTAATKLECQLAGTSGRDAAGNPSPGSSEYCALVWFERDHSCYKAMRCDGLTMLDRAWTLPLDESSAPASNPPPAPPPPPRSPPPPPPPHHGDARFGTPEEVCRPVSFSYDPTPYTALVAHGQCRSRGGSLASIHSQFDEATITGMIPRGTHVWIGLHDLSGGSRCNAQGIREWAWADGTNGDCESQPRTCLCRS